MTKQGHVCASLTPEFDPWSTEKGETQLLKAICPPASTDIQGHTHTHMVFLKEIPNLIPTPRVK